jgi:hypothetical protein
VNPQTFRRFLACSLDSSCSSRQRHTLSRPGSERTDSYPILSLTEPPTCGPERKVPTCRPAPSTHCYSGSLLGHFRPTGHDGSTKLRNYPPSRDLYPRGSTTSPARRRTSTPILCATRPLHGEPLRASARLVRGPCRHPLPGGHGLRLRDRRILRSALAGAAAGAPAHALLPQRQQARRLAAAWARRRHPPQRPHAPPR